MFKVGGISRDVFIGLSMVEVDLIVIKWKRRFFRLIVVFVVVLGLVGAKLFVFIIVCVEE